MATARTTTDTGDVTLDSDRATLSLHDTASGTALAINAEHYTVIITLDDAETLQLARDVLARAARFRQLTIPA